MRLLATSDLHYNHPKSRPSADAVIDRINAVGGDVLVVVGDAAVADGDALERCLSRFTFAGPKLFVPGNHELWTHRGDSHGLLFDEYPRRVRDLGWHWLMGGPFVAGEVAVVGSVGWYDYAFGSARLAIPRRFYAAKVSPAVAEDDATLRDTLGPFDDVTGDGRTIAARWNDGRFVKLGRSDEAFLDELLAMLAGQLDAVRHVPRVVAAVHHLPFAALLPPSRSPTWDFAHAYLGSPKIGELLLEYGNVRHVVCGHSHWPSQADVAHLRAVNTGCGYRVKNHVTIDV